LKASGLIPGIQTDGVVSKQFRVGEIRSGLGWMLRPLYVLAILLTISVWLIAIRAPLWLDETVSVFVIKGGFSEILSRQGWPGVPAYPVALWLWTKLMGTTELSLRMSSFLAMLGAAYLLYLAAKELFERDVAVIAAIFFCLHPVTYMEAIDVRPYSFAALTINACILALVYLRRNNSNWLAALFGLLAACIVYFQFLFIVILPALLISFVVLKAGESKTLWRQLSVAVVVFALAFLPMIPGLQYMFHTSNIHVFEPPPQLGSLGQVLGQKIPAVVLGIVIVTAAVTHHLDLRRRIDIRTTVLCASSALIPILLLYGVSVETSVHVFVFRYRLVAVPGVALCWALAISCIRARGLRLLFCFAFVIATGFHYYVTRGPRLNDYTWKYALAFVEKNASTDHASVLVCSDLPESNYLPMPSPGAVKDSVLFAPLAYYDFGVPAVALPRALNQDAIRIGSQFLKQAALNHERFVAVAYTPSYSTLTWLSTKATEYTTRQLGDFNGIKVLEFRYDGPSGVSR
jgi:hypothetical protein